MSRTTTTTLRADAFQLAAEEDDKGLARNWALDQLLKTRTLKLFGAVNNAVARKVIDGLLMLEAADPDAPITLIVNSPGGSVTDGFAIYDTIRFVKPDVKILCMGLCASIATVILMAPEKKHRLSLPHTEFLIHQPLIHGNIIGQASDLEITAKEIIKTRARINQLLAEETGQKLDVVQLHTERDYWMKAPEALEYGLIAGIVDSRAAFEKV